MKARILIVLFGLLASSLAAQTLDHPITYPVTMTAGAIQLTYVLPGHESCGTCIPGSYMVSLNNTTLNQQAGTNRSRDTAVMVPSRTYTLSGLITRGHSVSVAFRPPPGMYLYVDGVIQDTLSIVAPRATSAQDVHVPYSFTSQVRLEFFSGMPLPDIPAGFGAGEASALVGDKPMWYVGLGSMRDGRAAGALGFRQINFANTGFFTPAILEYDPVDATEVAVIRVSGVLRQIFAREALADIQVLTTTSYRIAFYPRSQVGALTGGLYLLTGSPFVTYTVSKLSSGAMTGVQIDRDEDGVVTRTALELNNTTWTHRDWRRSDSTAVSYTQSAYATPTAATVSLTGPNSAGTAQETPLTWTKTFTDFGGIWGKELTETRRGAGSPVPLVEQYAYYTATDAATGAQIRKMKSAIATDGSWTKYLYFVSTGNEDAEIQRVYRPWLDGPASPDLATTANSQYEEWTYTSVPTMGGTLPATKLSCAPGGILLAKTTWTYNANVGTLNTYVIASTTRQDFASAADTPTTVTKAYLWNNPLAYLCGKVVSVAQPDGRKQAYAYYVGTWNATTRTFAAAATGEDRLILGFNGQATAGTQTPAGISVSSWSVNAISRALDPLYLVAGRSTVTESVVDTTGRTVFAAQNVYTASGTLERVGGTVYRYDSHGRLTEEVDLARSTATAEVKTVRAYAGQLLSTVTAADGTVTKYECDSLLRTTRKTAGHGGPTLYPARIDDTRYDGANRVVETYTCACATAPTSFLYDSAGRLFYKGVPAPGGGELGTTYSYPDTRTVTESGPTCATRTNATFLDGRTKSVTGTAQPATYFDYSANATGLLVTRKNSSVLDQGWASEQQDWLGRTVTRSTPTWNWTSGSANVLDAAFSYSATTGQLARERTTHRTASGTRVLPDKLYAYRADGSLQWEGLDVDESGTLTEISIDRIQAYNQWLEKDSLGWAAHSTVNVGRSASVGLTTELSETVTRLTGFNGGTQPQPGTWVAGETVMFNSSGRSATSTAFIQPSTRSSWTESTAAGVSGKTTTLTTNGYGAEETSPAGVKMKLEYDSYGRLQYRRGRWNGTAYASTTTYAYHGNTEFVASVDSDGIAVGYTYAWNTDGTRRVTSTDALGKTSHTLYNAYGQPWRSWGSAASPLESGYDALGRRTTLTQWRTGDFTAATWPAAPGAGDITTWDFEAATGLLNEKRYADHTAGAPRKYSLTYTKLGQVAMRTNARGIETTYGYFDGGTTTTADAGHRTQALRNIVYSDATPGVSYAYGRTGLVSTVTDATGTRTFGYRDDLQLDREELPTGFYGTGRILRPSYESGTAVGRATGFQLEAAGVAEFAQSVAFNSATGRIDNLTGAGRTFNFGYTPGTNWIGTTTSGTYSRTQTLHTSRPVLQTVAQSWGTGGPARSSSYGSGFDSRGLRNSRTFADQAAVVTGSTGETLGYDDRGELVSAVRPAADSLAWGYDLAGNRTSANNNGAATSYTPTAVNQYAAITGAQAETGLAYDSDGDIAADATWSYAYDAENRLKQMEKKDGSQTLQFVYDYLNRRVQKTVRSGGETGTVLRTTKFVWQGWKLVAELDGGTAGTGTTLAVSYTWGPDFSDGRGAAGGAGGLLAVQQGGTAYLPTYDELGNVTGYVTDAAGAVATCNYDSLGRPIALGGAMGSFAFGYATQYTDRETGLVYYGQRYYDPKHGRFINRDPIEESGGINLYGFVGNSPANAWDVLGLSDTDVKWPYNKGEWHLNGLVGYSDYVGTTPDGVVGILGDMIVDGTDHIKKYQDEETIRTLYIGVNFGAQSTGGAKSGASSGSGGKPGSSSTGGANSGNDPNKPGAKAITKEDIRKKLCSDPKGREIIKQLLSGTFKITLNNGGFIADLVDAATGAMIRADQPLGGYNMTDLNTGLSQAWIDATLGFEEVVSTVAHEGRHSFKENYILPTTQDRETDAYVFEEQFRISAGFGAIWTSNALGGGMLPFSTRIPEYSPFGPTGGYSPWTQQIRDVVVAQRHPVSTGGAGRNTATTNIRGGAGLDTPDAGFWDCSKVK